MKKVIVMIVAAVLFCSMFTGCFSNKPSASGTNNEATSVSDTENSTTTGENTETGNADTEEMADMDENTDKNDDTVTESNPDADELMTDTGIYQGQIDSNSVEIKVKDEYGELVPKAFRLSQEIKESIDSFGLEMGDEVKVQYTLNEYGQPVITVIEKI